MIAIADRKRLHSALSALLNSPQGNELHVLLLAIGLGRKPSLYEAEMTARDYGLIAAENHGTLEGTTLVLPGGITINLAASASASSMSFPVKGTSRSRRQRRTAAHAIKEYG